VTYIEVEKEQSSKGNEAMPLGEESNASEGRDARDARARGDAIVTDGDESCAENTPSTLLERLIDLWIDHGKTTLHKLWRWFAKDTGLGQEHPAPLAELFAYWWRAPMAGDSTFLRWVQRIDGFTIGLFFALTGRAWAWLGERPLRRSCFLLLLFIVWRF
jgi:hypothetical protein